MKQKILVKDLKPGMYVTDLDRPWLETHFLFQGFQIKNQQDIEEISRICDFVYIDIEEDAPSPSYPSPAPAKISFNNADETPATAILKPKPRPYVRTLEDEYHPARQIKEKVTQSLTSLLDSTKQGFAINTSEIKHSVMELVESVLRNPDALTLLSNLNDKDEFEASRSINVCIHSITFGRYLGMDQETLLELGLAGLLHDIGEICVPSHIMRKTGTLTEEERNIMQTHTTRGAEILKHAGGVFPSTVETALSHHERLDGSGYPQGLKGDKPSFLTKIVGLVDVFDAVICPRIGKPISVTDALKLLYGSRDTLFEAELVEQFIRCYGIYPIGSLVELTTGEVGIVIASDQNKRLLPKLLLVLDKQKTPYYPPHIINLALLAEKTQLAPSIVKVLPHHAYGIDIKDYLLQGDPFGKQASLV